MPRGLPRPSLIHLALLLAPLAGCASRTTEARLSPERMALNVQAFDQVWTTVREKHWDPQLGGLDWESVRDELRPQVAAATSQSEARGLMRNAIARLGVSHFGIIPSDLYSDIDSDPAPPADTPDGAAASSRPAAATPLPSRHGVPGFDVQVVDGRALVTRVHDSRGTASDVRPGWVVYRVAGERIDGVLRRLADQAVPDAFRPYFLDAALRRRLTGEPGSRLAVEFLDQRDRKLRRTVQRVEPRGRPVTTGNLPTVYVEFESRRMTDGVLLIRFNQFFDPVRVMGGFEDALRANRDARGVIIDLRGNTGGLGGMAMGMAGWFISQKGLKLGTMTMRNARFDFIVTPRARTFDGPLAILVDGSSMSTSEIFAGGLQDIGRARVFGTPTPGAALPSAFERLPNGDRFQYAFADYVSAGGKRLEGHGVQPDQVVQPTRAALLAGRDAVVDAALEWIRRGAAPTVQ